MRKALMAGLLVLVAAPGVYPSGHASQAKDGKKPASQSEAKKPELPQPKIKVGDIAPDFTLVDTKGNKVSLHDFRGKKNVALAFYVFAFTGG